MSLLHAGLSSETTEKARLELNENPDTLHQDIQQVYHTPVSRLQNTSWSQQQISMADRSLHGKHRAVHL